MVRFEPTRDEIERALTLDRFDDSCADPVSADGCPMININRVAVRDQRCRKASRNERAGIRGRYIRAVTCRFESAVSGGARISPPRWHADEAMLFLVAPPSWCSPRAKTDLCAPRWRASPSPE